jgi:2-oxoglutarate dehydrogenase E2 component (dihydrolipoamide succinyltransferase)
VLRWCKAAGDAVRKDEPLLELETDKVTVEIPSPATGKLVEILKQPNEEVEPGQILARVRIAAASDAGPTDTKRTAASTAAQSAAAQEGSEILSPAVKRPQRPHHGARRRAAPRSEIGRYDGGHCAGGCGRHGENAPPPGCRGSRGGRAARPA